MKLKQLIEQHPLGPVNYLPPSILKGMGKQLGKSSNELFDKLDILEKKISNKYNDLPLTVKEIFEKVKTVISISGNLFVYKNIINFLINNELNENAIIIGLIVFILGSHKKYKSMAEAIIQRIKYIIGDYVFFATLDNVMPLLNGGVPELGGLFRNIIMLTINTFGRKLLTDKDDENKLSQDYIQKLINNATKGDRESYLELKKIVKMIKKQIKN
jgi:hypothetical protein